MTFLSIGSSPKKRWTEDEERASRLSQWCRDADSERCELMAKRR